MCGVVSDATVDIAEVSIPYWVESGSETFPEKRLDLWIRERRDWRRISPRNIPETRFSNIWKPGLILCLSTASSNSVFCITFNYTLAQCIKE